MIDDGLTITVLGSGTSHGVPMIGCDCPICTSDDPRDRRTRVCVAISWGETTILVDTGPELRLQCVACDIRRVDAVFYTHHHIDHIAGLDDLRRFNWLQRAAIPCYAQPETLTRLRSMFAYVFEDDPNYPSAKPQIDPHVIEGPVEIGGREVVPITLMHGPTPILGFRVGAFAYCTDVSEIPDASWPLLEGLDVLILDGLRRRPHPTHFNLEQAVEHAKRIGAKRTFFTHIAHELKHAETCGELPPTMELAYDGLVIRSD